TVRPRARPFLACQRRRAPTRSAASDRTVPAGLGRWSDDAACAPALLRVVAVSGGHGFEGPAGTAGPPVAVDHDAVHPRLRRARRGFVDAGEPAAGTPIRKDAVTQ